MGIIGGEEIRGKITISTAHALLILVIVEIYCLIISSLSASWRMINAFVRENF